MTEIGKNLIKSETALNLKKTELIAVQIRTEIWKVSLAFLTATAGFATILRFLT